MDTQTPACSCKDGCGIPSDKTNEKVNGMTDEQKQNSMELASATPPVSEPVSPAPAPQPSVVPPSAVPEEKPVEEQKECPHVKQIADLEKSVSDKDAEILALKKKVDDMLPGYNSFLENRARKTEEYTKIVQAKNPKFNSAGMPFEQLEQVAFAVSAKDAEEAKKIDDSKKLYEQMNNTEVKIPEKLDYIKLNREIRKKMSEKK